ncbi:MAG: FGGY family carbohydrate kinase, partial [Candidatus Atribacteria bacterium]|nr:FGGY family carbohydrate kinase [Candidatus Atribacteria bacterium]
MSYMGVDIGTTGSKVTVINENGEIIYHDAMGYPLHLSEGVRAELFPGEMWSAFQTLVSRAGQTCEKKDPIRSLALSLLGEAVMPVDDRGVPLDNTLVSMDYRGGKQAQEIAEKVEPRMIYDQTGQHCHPMYSASKILWWKEITPEIFSRTWKFLCWEDFLSLKLCGKPFIDHSLATRTMFFDIQEKKWSVDILTSLDLSPDLFSEVIPSGIPIGPVLPKMVEELHLPPDIILVSGAWDQACATLGAGLHSSDVFLDSFGTTMCLGVCVDRPVLNQGLFHSGYQTTCFIFPGSYFVNGGSMNGGVLLKWYRDQLKEELRDKLVHERKDFFETTMETLDYTPSPLYMMPYFAGKGT